MLLTLLAACAGPMDQREAQSIAADRMTRYCGDRCGPYRLTGTQHLKGRWLVDFDNMSRKFAVAVAEDGNTELTVWDKAPGR